MFRLDGEHVDAGTMRLVTSKVAGRPISTLPTSTPFNRTGHRSSTATLSRACSMAPFAVKVLRK